MAEITLIDGRIVFIDDEDVPLLAPLKWRLQRHCNCEYAVTGKKTLMHRLLLPSAPRIDHVDGNGLNNKRDNLRPCTHQQNMCNRRKVALATSRFKGVTFEKDRATWRAGISIAGKTKALGRFAQEADAARAYDAAARQQYGEFARTNF